MTYCRLCPTCNQGTCLTCFAKRHIVPLTAEEEADLAREE